MKLLAFVLFLIGGLIVVCNIQLTIASARNTFNKINKNISVIPIIDSLFIFLGVRVFYYIQFSIILSFGTFVCLFISSQLLYYITYKTTLRILRLKHKPN